MRRMRVKTPSSGTGRPYVFGRHAHEPLAVVAVDAIDARAELQVDPGLVMPADPAPVTTTSRSVIDDSTVTGDADPAEDAVRRTTSREKAGAPLGGERGSLADTGDCVTSILR
jgi:hypothetical protein